jgi:hypothetical protein
MARKKPQEDTISKLEAKILEMLEDDALSIAERIQLLNAGTRLAVARHKIVGDDKEGSYFD